MVFEVIPGGVAFDVIVAPRSSRLAILGVHDNAMKVSLNSPPVDGKANKELVAFLAKELGIAKRQVEIVRGHTSRRKRVHVLGRSADEVAALCRAHCAS